MSDLVERLLAAIDKRQKEALSISAGRFVESFGGRRVDPELSRYMDTVADPDAVFRLCQAHRKIIGKRMEAATYLAELSDARAHGAVVMGVEGALRAWDEALRIVAGGYGITTEESS